MPKLLLFTAFLCITGFAYTQTDTVGRPVIEWERMLGGSFLEEANDLLVEPNGNIVAVGKTYSVDGDVSSNHGEWDGFFVKLDASGNTIFTKAIGGSLADEFSIVLHTPDNGYLCVGLSHSGDGDLTGNNGDADAWLVKLSSAGDIEWSRNYGNANTDKFISAEVLHDGNIALIMESYPPLHPYLPNERSVLKLDASGNIIWQAVANTGNSIVETRDHKLLTTSGLLFDETNGISTPVIWNIPGDIWYLKKINGRIYALSGDSSQFLAGYFEEGIIYNFIGKGWAVPRDFGDGYRVSYAPFPRGIAFLPSSDSYVVTGLHIVQSRGGIFEYGMMSIGGVPQILPTENRDWDRLFAVVALSGGDEFICAGRRYDSSGNFWIAKYTVANTIRGNVFLDLNSNSIQDVGEPPFNNLQVRSSKYRHNVINTTRDGVYSNFVDTGFYSTAPVLYQLPYFVASPASDTVTFSNYKNNVTKNFAIQKIAEARDYGISLVAYTPARPGFHVRYKITCSNKGTDTISNKPVQFIKDSRLQLVSTEPLFAGISGDTIYWNANNISPGEEANFFINLTVGTVEVSIGDILNSYVAIDSTGDVNTANNTDSLMQVVTGSFDPNDKAEIHGDQITKLQVENGQYLVYTIRFQNTGNDTAFTVIIRDTLDSRLQWSTTEALISSHPYAIKVKDGRYVECVFQDIKLVDSLHNEPASHGFISYRIRPKTNLAIGDIIRNSASIYFDFNAPVKTNTQTTRVVNTTAVWTGAVDSLWDNPANWNINLIPDAETVVIIPANVPHYPQVNVQAVCYALRVDKNAVIHVNDGNNLEITGKQP